LGGGLLVFYDTGHLSWKGTRWRSARKSWLFSKVISEAAHYPADLMNNASETIPGYAYVAEALAKSWLSLQEPEQLKISVDFTAEDETLFAVGG
jgi:hypothetical protein